MSCIFCYSLFHLSQNCKTFISDGDRKVVAQTRKLCEECLSQNCVSENSFHTWTECKSLNICRICFSKNHNTIFCPDRFTGPNFFIPNIDQNLLLRFLAILDADERQLLAFQSPIIFNLCKLFPLTISETLYIGSLDNHYFDPHIITCKNFELCYFRSSEMYNQTFYNIVSKNWKFYAENIKISKSRIFTPNFYALLSTKTKQLILKLVNFSNKITMDEILKYAPNLEEFDYEFGHGSVDNANLMLDENFFQYSYGRKFRKLKITVYCNTNVKKLLPFLEKSTSNIQIDIYVNIPPSIKTYGEMFLSKMSEFFVPSSSTSPSVSFYIEKWENTGNWKNSYDFVGTFVIKEKTVADVLV